MAIFKEVWQFQGSAGVFWNEVYYSEANNLEDAATFSPQFLARRLGLLHSSCTWSKIRVSDIATPRVSTIKTINLKGRATVSGVDTGPANVDEAAVLTLASSARPSSRKVWMRGIPESYITRRDDGATFTSAAYDAAKKTFLDGLCNPAIGYVVLTRKRVGQEGITRFDVQAAEWVEDTQLTKITTKVNHTLLAGQYAVFNLFSAKTFPGLRGVFRVEQPVTATTFHIAYHTVGGAAYNVSRGYVFKYEVWTGAFLNRNLCDFAYLGSRRSKNVATGSRGARRATPLRHQ